MLNKVEWVGAAETPSDVGGKIASLLVICRDAVCYDLLVIKHRSEQSSAQVRYHQALAMAFMNSS